MPGVRTAGVARPGRREYYGALDLCRVVGLSGRFDGADLGGLAPMQPACDFGFSSAPRTPSVTTQGMKEPEMVLIAELIARILRQRQPDLPLPLATDPQRRGLPVDVAVERLFEHALMDFDRIDTCGLGAAALAFEGVAKVCVV